MLRWMTKSRRCELNMYFGSWSEYAYKMMHRKNLLKSEQVQERLTQMECNGEISPSDCMSGSLTAVARAKLKTVAAFQAWHMREHLVKICKNAVDRLLKNMMKQCLGIWQMEVIWAVRMFQDLDCFLHRGHKRRRQRWAFTVWRISGLMKNAMFSRRRRTMSRSS